METNQLTGTANQLIGFYKTRTNKYRKGFKKIF